MHPINSLIVLAALAILFFAVLYWSESFRAFTCRTLSSQRGTLSSDLKLEYSEGVEVDLPVINADIIYAGGWTCVNAAGYALPGSDTAGLIFMGIATQRADNSLGALGAISVPVRRRGLIKAKMATAITIANVGDNVFLVDDESVDVTGNVTHNIFCGIIAKYIDTTHAMIDIEPAVKQADVATHIADTSAAHAASAISILDAGLFTTAAQVEAALQEIYRSLLTAKGIINIPTPAFNSAGVALAAFTSEDQISCGYCVTAKGLGIRWNNHATPGPAVGIKVAVPPDADITANMTLHILAAKVGATAGDLTKFTVLAYNNVVGALYDVDDDFGGDTGAMANSATKTIQKVTLTLALANLAADPAAMELTIKPKDGTLGTDDVIMFAAWIEYQKKLLTA